MATKLGPTFIKLGQALSIRTDLISEAYALELRKLQGSPNTLYRLLYRLPHEIFTFLSLNFLDAVPPFDSDLAKQIVCEELKINSLDDKFKYVSDLPIASASIGQVYKAVLLDGRTVAIKVQR